MITRVCVEGLNVTGSNIAIRRVRIINAGTQTPAYEYLTSVTSWECFALGVTSSGPGNIVEDCILEQFGKNNAREVTCLAVGAGGDGAGQQKFFTTVVRNCLVNCQTDGRTLSSVFIKSVTPPGPSPTVEFEFWEDHDKAVNDFIRISDVVIQTNPSDPTSTTGNNPYNGYFKVTAVGSTKKLTVNLLANSNAVSGSLVSLGQMPRQTQGITAGGGLNNVVEGCRVTGALFGAYQDTWQTRGYVFRNNYFRDVAIGIYLLIGGLDAGYVAATRNGSISKTTGASSNVRFTMASGNHYRSVGDVIEIADYYGGNAAYFGRFVVTEIIDSSTFGWKMNPLPSPDPGVGDIYRFFVVATCGTFFTEANIIDLQLERINFVGAFPYGIAAGTEGDPSVTEPSIFKNVFHRGNIIRNSDNQTQAGRYSIGISQNVTETYVLENNIITVPDSGSPTVGPAVARAIKVYKTFNNQNEAGRLIRPYYTTESRYIDGIEADVEDAILMLLLQK